MNKAYKSILKATTLFGGVQSLNILINIVRTKLVAVLIGPEGVGLNSIYNETRELLRIICCAGLDTSAVRSISQAYEGYTNAQTEDIRKEAMLEVQKQVSLLRSFILMLAVIGMALCILLSSLLSKFSFGDYSHAWGYVILSPAVAFTAVSAGEMAVLKGMRELKLIARISVIYLFLALFITIPFYYFMGIDGVLPGMLGFTSTCMAVTLLYGYRVIRTPLVFGKGKLSAGSVMLGIGIVYVVSEALGKIVTLGIQSYLNNVTSLHVVGLYNAGFTMTITYIGLVLAAMETDYYPRLSGVVTDMVARRDTVVRQIEVNIMLAVPVLAFFIILLPYIVPLLLDSKFNEIVPMTQMAAVGMLFRAVVLPNTYLPLAAGHSRIFFIVNLIGALDMIVVIPGYVYGGLVGIGVALTLQNLLDMLIAMGVSRFYYNIKFSLKSIAGILAGTFILSLIYYLSC